MIQCDFNMLLILGYVYLCHITDLPHKLLDKRTDSNTSEDQGCVLLKESQLAKIASGQDSEVAIGLI